MTYCEHTVLRVRATMSDDEKKWEDEVGGGKNEMEKLGGIQPAFIHLERGSVVSSNKATKHP